jgi:hypothetical protein
MPEQTCGWNSDLPTFRATAPRVVRLALQQFIRDASPEQLRAWDESIPWLQRETAEFLSTDAQGETYTAILEYRLPLDSRRPDVIVLLDGPVVVMELKGKMAPSQADLDQVAAYARDLRCYHRECHERPLHAVLVPTRAGPAIECRDGVYIVGPEGIDGLLRKLRDDGALGVPPESFLDIEAYRPLPSLVHAARELFLKRELRQIKRAHSATEPAVRTIARIAHDAARTGTRHLVLVTGVPGSGKTLVGLSTVHAPYLDDLAIARQQGKPASPAVFLSGNGPLVEVLQYQLRDAGGGGQTFVRGVKDYLDAYVPRPGRPPPEHVLVFDEAQRAFSAEMVATKHLKWAPELVRSEPALFVELCERIPQWCVLVGLIGSGQEIHRGEEEGLGLWREALEGAGNPDAWTVHAPCALEGIFAGSSIRTEWEPALSLNTTLRSHLATQLHEFVDGVLRGSEPAACRSVADTLWRSDPRAPGGVSLWVTRSLDLAKRYLRNRYGQIADARFGIVASSKDKDLERQFGIPNGYQSTKRVRFGPWYAGDSAHSCRQLETVVTEFGAQGLELDMTLLAWGTDLIRIKGQWSIARAGGYRRGDVPVRDPFQLRINAYRVLLTRGRDGTILFVPPLREMDETWGYLVACGFRDLPATGEYTERD